MTLPKLPFEMPPIELPFEVALLSHPPVVHFVIALPIVILLIELVNLVLKNRTLSITSLLLLLLTSAVAVAAYLTGGIDGKEAFPLLTEDGQAELKAHKLLGTYLMLMSGVVVVFKVLSMLIGRVTMKILYLVMLILFIAGLVWQGEEGGELVYEHGANVERVKALDDELFDLKEELEELKEENKEEAVEEAVPAEKAVETEAVETTPATEESAPAPAVKEEAAPAKEEVAVETVENVEAAAGPVVAPASTQVEEKVKVEAPAASAEPVVEDAVETIETQVEEVQENTVPHIMPH